MAVPVIAEGFDARLNADNELQVYDSKTSQMVCLVEISKYRDEVFTMVPRHCAANRGWAMADGYQFRYTAPSNAKGLYPTEVFRSGVLVATLELEFYRDNRIPYCPGAERSVRQCLKPREDGGRLLLRPAEHDAVWPAYAKAELSGEIVYADVQNPA